MRPEVTELIANNLHSLPSEDGRPMRFMHHSQFAGGGTDPKVQAAVKQLGAQTGEGIQLLLERNGWTLTHQDDVKPADADGYKKVRVWCTNPSCRYSHEKPLMSFGCDEHLNARLGNVALKSLSELQHECQP